MIVEGWPDAARWIIGYTLSLMGRLLDIDYGHSQSSPRAASTTQAGLSFGTARLTLVGTGQLG